MDIKEALTFDGLKYFYSKYIKPLKTGAFSTVVNNATTTVANTVLDGRMGKTLADKDANLQSQINTLNNKVRSIVVASKTGVSVSTSTATVTVDYNVPVFPLAVIPIVHGGVPVYCSVNSWTQTSAQVMLRAGQSSSNRVLQLIIIY